MAVERFNASTWIIGSLFTLVLLFGGAAFAFQSSALSTAVVKLNEHAERIAKLEALMQMQVEINKELKELHKQYDRRGPQ